MRCYLWVFCVAELWCFLFLHTGHIQGSFISRVFCSAPTCCARENIKYEAISYEEEDPPCPKSRIISYFFSAPPIRTTAVFIVSVDISAYDRKPSETDYLSAEQNFDVQPLHADYSHIFILLTGMKSNRHGFSPAIIELKKLHHLAVFITIVGFDGTSLPYAMYKNRAPAVGEFAHRLVQQYLLEDKTTLMQKIHIIGFSLGAHVAGIVGNLFQGEIPRITGLDPAKPGFEWLEPRDRLDRSSAKFVDVIHSDTCRFGVERRVGHVDFYPDGGQNAPDICGASWDPFCNHNSAKILFVDSISDMNYNFVSRECSSWRSFEDGSCSGNSVNTLGYPASKPTTLELEDHMKYYLYTNKQKHEDAEKENTN